MANVKINPSKLNYEAKRSMLWRQYTSKERSVGGYKSTDFINKNLKVVFAT